MLNAITLTLYHTLKIKAIYIFKNFFQKCIDLFFIIAYNENVREIGVINMKKRYLKNWIVNLLFIIQVLLVLLLASDTTNLSLFIISKIIMLTIFLINHFILYKYSKLF